jgi:hypothetical protein
LYVLLADSDSDQEPISGSGSSGRGVSSRGGDAATLAAAWQTAVRLVAGVEAAFLRHMLQPEPGWLTHHCHRGDVDGDVTGGVSGARGSGGGLGWPFEGMRGLFTGTKAAAAAVADSGSGGVAGLGAGARPPAVLIPVACQVGAWE